MQIKFFLKVSLVVVWVVSFCTFFTLITSCTKKTESAVTNTGSRIVNLIIWSNYVSPELLARFEKQSKIKVQVSNYASNEELLAKLQAGATGYDVAVPSDYMVFAMSKLGLLHELEPGALSNFKNIDAKFLKKSFDPQNRVSVPYDWGTTGIAVNRKLYRGELKGWKNVFHNPKLKGKFTLLDDVRETIGASLKCLGKSLNTKNTEDLTKAKAMLLKVRDEVKGFTSEPMMPLVLSETAVAHAYMSDALQARNKSKNPDIEYIIPEEGGTLWIDNLVIPRGAPHLKEAHEFINFLLEAQSSVSTVMSVFVSPTNKGTFSLLPKDFQTNLVLFPKETLLAKTEMMEDLGEGTKLWEKIWTEIKAGY